MNQPKKKTIPQKAKVVNRTPNGMSQNKKIKTNNVISIIGMHRSGTSMVAKLLNLCGLDLGPSEQFLEPNEYNPLGYFENENFTFKINDQLLAHFDGSWDNPPNFKDEWEYSSALTGLVDEASALIKTFSKSKNWGWKDPRTTLLLPFWKSLIPNIKFVICVRSPLEVAKSLAKRDRIPIQKGVYLWNQYMRAAIRNTENDSRIFMFYEDFFGDAPRQIERLTEFCGLQKPIDQSILFNAISYDLKHHTSETSELINDNKVLTEYKLSYIGLRALTSEKLISQGVHAKLEAVISENINKFYKLLEQFHDQHEVARLQTALTQKEQELTQKSEEIHQHQNRENEAKTQLGKIEIEQIALNNTLAKLNTELQAKEELVHQFTSEQKRLLQMSEELQENLKVYQKNLAKKEEKVETLDSKQLELNNEILLLKSSLSEKENDFVQLEANYKSKLNEFDKKDEAFENLVSQHEKIASEFLEIQALLGIKDREVEHLKSDIQAKQNELDNQQQKITANAVEFDELSQKLNELHLRLEQKESDLKHLKNEELTSVYERVAQHQSTIQSLQQEVCELKEQVTSVCSTNEEQEIIINRVNFEKRELLDTLARINNSIGWKLTTKVYDLEDKLVPLGSKRRNLYELMWNGFKTLCFKGWSSFAFEVRNYLKTNKKMPSINVSQVPLGAHSIEKISMNGNGEYWGKCILVIDRWVPTYDQDSGSLRMFELLKILNEIGWQVTFLPDDLKKIEPYTSELLQFGVEIVAGEIDIEDFLKREGYKYNMVMISRPEQALKYLPLIRAYCINSSVIYDTVDLHWLRMEREASINKNNELLIEAEYYKRLELLNAECSDITLTISEDEKLLLLQEKPHLKVEVLANIHESYPTEKSFDERRDLMFIGGFYHKPNEDAVFYFVKEILPIVRRELGDVKFYIVGSNPSQDMYKLASENIVITGYVKNVAPYFNNSRVFVAPLRYGAGMKGKIGQSMAYGLPVVTTSIGAEGIGLVENESALIAQEPERFANAVIRLYKNEALWNKISKQSKECLEKKYSKEVTAKRLFEVFNFLNQNNRASAMEGYAPNMADIEYN